MKKILFMFLIAGLLLFIGGCQGNEDGNVKSSPYVGGTSGLGVNFAEDAPPKEIYDNGGFPFDIGIKLKNLGEFTIPKDEAKVTIKGIYYSDYGLNSPDDLVGKPEEDILGVRKNADGKVIDGLETRVEFTGLNYNGEITGSMTPVNLVAEACYLYETKTSANLCVRDKLTTSKEGTCKVNGVKKTYNSGAPINIDNFLESAISENKLAFSFDVVHVSNGKYFKQDSWCEEEYGVENKVHVKIESGIGTLKCSGIEGGDYEGEVRVSDGKGTVRCTMTLSQQELGDFEKPITITTTYKYRSLIDKQITLKHAGE